MPQGMFPGGSKKLYDALYLRTRGHIKPTRTIRATKKDLSQWSGIKNRKTIDAHLRYFDMVGLVRREWLPGQNDGYLFEVMLPEEIRGQGVKPPEGVRPVEASDQKSVRGSEQKLGSGGQTQPVDNIETSAAPQTIFKTVSENGDDEATRQIGELFKKLEREVIGKNSASVEQWREMCEVLLAELKIAAARTTVSSAPSFLAEHLRRRLWKMDKKQAAREGKELPDQTLNETKASPVECLDCNGSGWWYPNGTEKGVAKCRHSTLNISPQASQS